MIAETISPQRDLLLIEITQMTIRLDKPWLHEIMVDCLGAPLPKLQKHHSDLKKLMRQAGLELSDL